MSAGGQGRALPVQLFFLAAAVEATVVVDPRMATMDSPFQRLSVRSYCLGSILARRKGTAGGLDCELRLEVRLVIN